jgi:T3SS (YopN, CesT) and YbjN peptide-binding chaperone 1
MQFENDGHEEVFERVREYVDELIDEPYLDEETGHFYGRFGSTVLEISVDPYGPEEIVVRVMAYCVQGVRVEETLLEGLLELNHTLPTGSFSLVGTDVFFSQSLFGRSLEPRNFLNAIAAVATVADDYDDRIVARYGGETALERIESTGGIRRRAAQVAAES